MKKDKDNNLQDSNYFDGSKLYGDDFDLDEIEKWYKNEEEAFADLYGREVKETSYVHAVNEVYGFPYLKNIDSFNHVLGFGSSWGYEFLPIIEKIKALTIIDSSIQTVSSKLGNITPQYIQANQSGKINIEDNTFDLIVSFSALHHIPNVSFVLQELFRLLKSGSYFLLREPITSMGDWRSHRPGLTIHERGIPPQIFDQIIKNNNMEIVSKNYYGTMTSFLRRITNSHHFFESKAYFVVDKFLSRIFRFNMKYHPRTKWERIAPQYVFYVLRKK